MNGAARSAPRLPPARLFSRGYPTTHLNDALTNATPNPPYNIYNHYHHYTTLQQDVAEADYNEFFKATFGEFLDPLAHVHFNVEVRRARAGRRGGGGDWAAANHLGCSLGCFGD